MRDTATPNDVQVTIATHLRYLRKKGIPLLRVTWLYWRNDSRASFRGLTPRLLGRANPGHQGRSPRRDAVDALQTIERLSERENRTGGA
jgi:hypothetical protein